MKVRIYRPAKNAMQSGKANSRQWVVESEPSAPKIIDPLMGWIGSTDTQAQVKLRFLTEEQAIAYAKRNKLDYTVEKPQERPVRPRSYADNFRFDKVS